MESAAPSSTLRFRPTDLNRYGLAVLSTGVVLGAALLLERFHFHVPAGQLLLLACAITSWYGGTGPALLAVILSSVVFDYFFVEPWYTFSI